MAKDNLLETLVKRASDLLPYLHLLRIKDGHDFGTYNRHRSPADFVGHINGHPLLIECKETEEDRVYLSHLQRRPHQFKALRAWHQSHERAIAGYLFLFKRAQRLAFLPIQNYPIILKSIDIETPGIRTQLMLGTNWEDLFL